MANSTIVYACTEGGLGIVNRPGTSTEWLPLRLVLAGRVVASAWAEPGPPIRVMAVVDEGELLLSENGGRTWSPMPLLASSASLFEAGDPATPFVLLQNGSLAASSDGGATWATYKGLPGARVAVGAHAVVLGSTVYVPAVVGGEKLLLRGSAAGGDWRALSLTGIQAVAAITGHLYAATGAGVQHSEDGGASWATLDGSPMDATPLLAIPGPAGKPPALLAGAPSGLHLSPDGSTWQLVELPQPGVVTALTPDPQRRDRLYCALSTGYIFESGNRGAIWASVNAEPLPPVSALFVVRI